MADYKGKNIFFTYKMRIDTSSDTISEFIRLSKSIKNKLKKGGEKTH